MQKVIIHIIEAYKIHRTFLDYYQGCDEIKNKQQADSQRCTDKYDSLWYTEKENVEHIKAHATLDNYQNYQNKNINAQNEQGFLHNLEIQENGQQRNITWFECYILYRLRGYLKPIPNPEEPLPKPSLHKQLCTFKRISGM